MYKLYVSDDAALARHAKEMIEADLSIYDSASDLARKLGTNSARLKKIFKAHFDTTLFEFSRQLRMAEAKRLLAETNFTLQTIANRVGYTEGNNFQIAFKTFEGMTPMQWRNRL